MRRAMLRLGALLWGLVAGCGAGGGTAAGTPDAGSSVQDATATVDSTGPAIGDTAAGDASPAGADATFVPKPCDPTRPPVVMAHGFLASGDTWQNHVMRMTANGWCPERLRIFDWNSVAADDAEALEQLTAFVDAVLADSGADRIDLVGHSRGGALSLKYLAEPSHRAKVARYAHVASVPADAPPEDVPMLNLWSTADQVVTDRGDIPGAENVDLVSQDHLAVATSPESFTAIHTFLTGTAPETTDIVPEAAPTLSGRALTLGENTFEAGATVTVWALDPATFERAAPAPAATLVTTAEGRWGPVAAAAGVPYEIVVATPDDRAPVTYLREPPIRANPLVYLRTFPPPDTFGGAFLAAIPFDDATTVVAVLNLSRAMVAGQDSLTIDGVETLTAGSASADQTTIALFAYDVDGDGQSSGEAAEIFATFPFLAGADVHLAASPERAVDIRLGDRLLRARTRPSKTGGAIIAMFD